MQFKSIITSPCGIRYILDQLNLQSGFSRNLLLDSEMLTNSTEIVASYRKLSEIYDILIADKTLKTTKILLSLQSKLQNLRDIRATIERIKSGELDDIELFEIKHLAMLNAEIIFLLSKTDLLKMKIVSLPDLTEVVNLLDPDKTGVANFYIYSSYSEELKNLRKQLQNNGNFDEEIFSKLFKVESKIKEELSIKLLPYSHLLENALMNLGFLDIFLAKAMQVQELKLCIPEVADNLETRYEGLFNPEIQHQLEEREKAFQPVDINFGNSAILLTGANMGGKTVVLKTLALSQYLFQFGFAIPAKTAKIDIKEEIQLCIGDEQSAKEGLSSFAAEMKRIDAVIEHSRKAIKILALIDEPARTTNPLEGTALVEALLKVLRDMNGNLLVTTHYNIVADNVKRLQVKGLIGDKMDYSLIEVHGNDVPHEALRIAEQLGIDEDWIKEARKIISLN
jgi:dsDNA-specific endonuclease/ATPase MutS2